MAPSLKHPNGPYHRRLLSKTKGMNYYWKVQQQEWIFFKRAGERGFPGGSVVKKLPANARDTGSISGQGISHRLWSNKACAPRACVPQQEKPPQRETHAPQLGSGSCLPQLEKSLCSKEDPEQTKINRWIKLYVSIIHAHTYIKPLWPSEKGQRLCYEVLEQAQLSDLWLQNRDQRWPSWLLVTGRKGQRVTSWGVTNRTAVYQVGSVLHSYLTFALS